MRKKYKKLLSWILCVCMIIGVIPSSSLAEDANQQTVISVAEQAEEVPENPVEVQEELVEDASTGTVQSSEEEQITEVIENTEGNETTEEAPVEEPETEIVSDTDETQITEENEETQEVITEDVSEEETTEEETEDEIALLSMDGAAVTAVKLVDTNGTVWGNGIITGSGDLDDVSWNPATGENKGYDDSTSNDIIRSFDSITYNVSATFSGLQTGRNYTLVYEVTLPDDDELTLDTEKMNAKSVECQKNDSGKTYICKYALAKDYAGGDKEENVIVKVGNKHQDDTITPTIKAYLEADQVTPAVKVDQDTNEDQNSEEDQNTENGPDVQESKLTVENMETVTVTTAPMYNIVLQKKRNESIVKDVYDFGQTSETGKTYYTANDYTNNKVTGYRCTYGFALEVRKPGNGIKGVELPDPNQNFTFDIDLSEATLNNKKLADEGFTPLLYYVGPNEAGGGAITEMPFTKQYSGNGLDGTGCYNSGNVSMTQDGTTLHVTVKNFAINQTQYPKKNYSGTSYWEDLNKIREGFFSAFQFQVVYPYINAQGENLQTKLGNGTVNVAATVSNMYAVSEQGHETTTESSMDDNRQTNTWSMTSGNRRNQQIFYSSRKNMIESYSPGQVRADGDIAAVGADNVAFTVSYTDTNVGEADERENLPVAIDQLVLFGRNAIQNVEYSKYMQQSTAKDKYGYACTVRYAVLKNGGHLDNESMRTAKMEDFNFYDTKPEGGCDAVLVQYRGTNLGAPDLTLHAQFNATVNKSAATADKVYMITAFTKVWTALDFASEIYKETGKTSLSEVSREEISNWGKKQKATQLVENKDLAQPIIIDNRGYYTVPGYKQGVYDVDDTHKFHITSADALYIVPYTTTVTKTVVQTDENGEQMKRYNVGKSQRYVDYQISSTMKFWADVEPAEGAKTTVYFEDTIPAGLTYITNSACWGGTYTSKFPQVGEVTGGQQIEPTEITPNEDGTTTLKWEIKDVEQIKGELPKLYYSCKIDMNVADNTTLKNTVTIQTDEDQRPIHKDNDNISSAAISVTRDKEFYIVKRGGDHLELKDESFFELVASNTSSEDRENLCVFDTMPYSGDRVSKQFEGNYQITSLTMDAADVNHESDMEIWYTSETKYIGKTADDIDPSEVTVANGWKKAEAFGYEGDTITFTGKGLIGGWPTVIAYKDANLKKNTMATLRLEYKAVAGAQNDNFTNIWSTKSNNKEIASKATTDVYNRTIEGTVWFDKNKDGKIDENEKKMAGVRVTLLVKNENNEYVPYTPYDETVNGKTYQSPSTVKTDANGHYKFSALPSGDYRVKFESSDGTNLGYYDVTTPNADKKDTTVTSKVEKENADKDEYGNLTSGTITDITMPSLDKMVEDNKGDKPKGPTYNLPDQNLGLVIPEIEIPVTKVWSDGNNQDGKRTAVEITLVADGKDTDKKLTLNDRNSWTGKFEHLSKYDETDMHTIQYTVKEKAVTGYTTEITGNATEGYAVTNTHTPETINISGSKTWDDGNNQDGKRPEKITIHLLANGKEVANKEVKEEDNWSWNFENLPKYANGTEITYTITEDAVEGYTSEITGDTATGYVVTNTRMPETINVSGSKTWNDADNQDGKRPDKITIRLLANGKEVASKNVTEADNWSWKFENVAKYEAGKEITYTITEDTVEGYTSEITGGAATGYVVTNTHTPETINVSGSKTWNDANNQDGKRPDKITIRLLANGKEVANKEVKETDNWSWNFENLPKYANGTEITYTITEDAVEGYTSEITGDTATGYVVTNTHTPETINVSGNKTWNDANNQDGKRPTSITISLWNGTTKVTDKVVTAATNWNWSFDNLDKYANGQPIRYTITEEKVPGYTTNITGDATNGFTVTNTHTPELISISGTKTWDDADNQDGKRPGSIKISLWKGTTKVGEKTVRPDEKGEWKWTFDNLPKYENGTPITYTTVEEQVPEYSTTINGNNVTNKYTPKKTSIQVTKAWEDANNRDGIRPNTVIVKLLANGVDTKKTLTLTASNNWTGTFTDLDEKKAGETIAYTVKEVSDLKGYTTTITGDAKKGYIVTNKHTPETTSISGNKTWKDADNQDGKRPKKITINLLANGIKVDSKEVTEKDNWSWTFTNLPKKEAGEDIIYTVTEEAVDNYTTEVNGYNVTNSYTPEKTSVQVTKAWDDDNNRDAIRPDVVVVGLQADGVDTGKMLRLTAENSWSGSFTGLDKRKDGKEIVYTVKEVTKEKGYTVTITGNAKDGFTVTNSYTPEKTSVSGSKTWKDANDQDGKRPEKITINLFANGIKADSRTVTADDNWSWTFDNLPKKEAGVDIVYTITEEAVAEYSTTVDGYNVTNSYTPGKTSISVTKAWEDSEDQDGIRPEEVTVRLVADGEDTDQILTLNKENNWSGSFTGLDEKKDGQDIIYTVKEDPVPEGYESVITGSTTEGYVITNTHATEVTEVSGSKTWNDNDSSKRPAQITINLFADGEKMDSKTVTADDNWSWKFENLPKKAAGKDIVYTITEDAVESYVNEVNGYDVTNTITKVSISKVDITDQKELEGAHIQIIDEKGNVIEEWDSTKTPHEVTGLKTGTTYTLRETVAPDGYDLTTDTTFVLKEDGTVDTAKTTTSTKDGVLLVEDRKKSTPNTTIAVTKKLVTAAGDTIAAVDQTFYVALYADSDCTKRVSDVKALVFKKASSATVTFDDVAAGVTYYVGECDKDGVSYLADALADGSVYTVEFGSGNVVKVEKPGGSSAVYFDNSFMETPDGFYKEGQLTIIKKLQDAEGNAIESDETFYAGIFDDADYTTLSSVVSENIILLAMNGGSEASVQMIVPVLEGQSTTLYVTEVDANGKPVKGTKGFAYEVLVENGEVVLSEAETNATVTITNVKSVEEESESESESENKSDKTTEKTNGKTTTSVKTGDNTPIGILTGLLLLSAAAIAGCFRRRKKKEE